MKPSRSTVQGSNIAIRSKWPIRNCRHENDSVVAISVTLNSGNCPMNLDPIATPWYRAIINDFLTSSHSSPSNHIPSQLPPPWVQGMYSLIGSKLHLHEDTRICDSKRLEGGWWPKMLNDKHRTIAQSKCPSYKAYIPLYIIQSRSNHRRVTCPHPHTQHTCLKLSST